MTLLAEYERNRETAWCPGCGNFPLRKALVRALVELNLGNSIYRNRTGSHQS